MRTVIGHFGFRVRDLARARFFYDAILPSLGLQAIDNGKESFLIGRSTDEPLPFIWVGVTQPAFWTSEHQTSKSPIHVAFKATSRGMVDAFHHAALASGGMDNGAPGPRGPAEMGYYTAFVLDPDGNNVEAGVRE
jgi:catechol 2,3-dioxygenase-like lactoylglutathione lyase family enzyme